MDELHKFVFDGLAVRGMVVRLGESWRELLARRSSRDDGAHPFAPPVRALLGEMAAAACLLQANLKFDGALVLQIFGDGPLKLAVVETQPDLGFRATAKVVGPVSGDADLANMVNRSGLGRCVVTLDPPDRARGQQPYQGVVQLPRSDGGHGRLGDALEHYMLQSEQLDTRLVLAASDDVAAGLLIQRLPMAGEANLSRSAALHDDDRIGGSEDYRRIAMLAATVKTDELLGLPPPELLRRLFWHEALRRFEPASPRFACRCSRERVAGMLRQLGRDEVDGLIREQGQAQVGCDFCGAIYRFDAVDAGELFSSPQAASPASDQRH